MNNFELNSATIVITSWENKFAVAGGVKAVTQEYAKHLISVGRKALVVTPLHTGLEKKPFGEIEKVSAFNFEFEGATRQVDIFQTIWDNVRWIYVGCDTFFIAEGGRDRSNPYLYKEDAKEEERGNGSPQLVRDCLFFAAVMPKVLTALNLTTNLVLHLQDWETSPVALTLKDAVDRQEISGVVSALALHNPYDTRMDPPSLKTDGWKLISSRDIPNEVPTFLGRLLPLIDAPPTTVSREFAVDLTSDQLQTQHLADHLQTHFNRRGIMGVDNGPFRSFRQPFTDRAIENAKAGMPDAILNEKRKLRQCMVDAMCDYRPKERWGNIDFDTLTREKSTAPVFMCVGRLDEGQKGYDVLARAIEFLSSENFNGYFILTSIVGNTPQPFVDDLKKLAENCKGHVVVYPMRMDMGYAEIQAGSSFSLWPSMYEPFGAVSEFLLQGTPIIARSTGGLRQQIDNFELSNGKGNGVLYETRDPDPGGTSLPDGTWCANEWRAIQMEKSPHSRMKYPVYKDQVTQLVEAIKRSVRILGDPIAHGRLLSNLYSSVSGYSWKRAEEEYCQNYVRH